MVASSVTVKLQERSYLDDWTNLVENRAVHLKAMALIIFTENLRNNHAGC